MSHQDRISPYVINTISCRQVMRIKNNIYKLIQYQILQTNITRTVGQTVRRISNEILGVKELTIGSFSQLADIELTEKSSLPAFHCPGITFDKFFIFVSVRSTRANHSYKLYVNPERVNSYKHSFFICMIRIWSNSPRDFMEADNLQLFNPNLGIICYILIDSEYFNLRNFTGAVIRNFISFFFSFYREFLNSVYLSTSSQDAF